MATIGFATLQIIPSLQGVSEAIEKQVAGKVVSVKVEPKVDQPATERAGKQAKETVEKHTKTVKVEPKVDQRAAEDAGKKTGESVQKGLSASTTAIGGFLIQIMQGSAGEAGKILGERLANNIPQGMTGVAERIGTALRNSLPTIGQSAGTALGTALGVGLANAIGKDRLDRAGKAIKDGLTKAVAAANVGVDVGTKIGTQLATGLTNASGVVGGAAATLKNTIGDVTEGVTGLKEFLGGQDSFAAPALDGFNEALGKATPLLNAVTGATTLAAAGAQSISLAVGVAQKAQLLWNAALIANPIGLIVAAIAAVVAGLVLFFTKTELGRKIWEGFTTYLKVAWEGIKIAFGAAWDVIKAIFDGMVTGAKLVWEGIKAQFTGVVDFVKGLPAAIGNAARGMWDAIGNAFKTMVNGLIFVWNKFSDMLSFTVPDITGIPNRGERFTPIPKITPFGGGGYTGGNPDQIAGIVHGGEYVIKASSTAGIQNAMPGLLDYLNNKGALPGYAAGGLVAGADQLRSIIAQRFGITNIGGWRPADKYGEHSTGRALDVMTSNKALGDAVKDFAIANASAIDLKWAIWQQKMWYPDGSSKAMADRGNPTQNHMDHVHIFSGPGITNGLRGALAAGAAPDSSMLAMPDPTGVSAPDETGAISSAVAPQAATESTKVQLASSISGLAGTGLGELGKGVGTTPKGTSDLSVFGNAANAAVTGQVSSALGVLGVNDSPGWLKGASMLLNSASISDGAGSAAPLSASTPAMSATGSALSGIGGAQQPVSQVNYNVRTATVEDAFLVAQRREKERAAAEMSRIA